MIDEQLFIEFSHENFRDDNGTLNYCNVLERENKIRNKYNECI